MSASTWQKCSICGKPLFHGGRYYLCSVSTCNRKRLTYRFCSPDCWDAHLPDMNHRNPECIEERAPARPGA
jgi:hypothetical protein